MKGLIIAMFVAGTGLLLAALFWPASPTLRAQRNQRNQPNTAPIQSRDLAPAVETTFASVAAPRRDVSAMPATESPTPSPAQQISFQPLVPTPARPRTSARDSATDRSTDQNL